MRPARWLASFVVLLVLALASVAFAQERSAADLKKDGDRAMDALRYDDALAAYRAAYAATGDPALLYNQARASEALGDYPSALALIDRFEKTAPDSLKARIPDLAGLKAEVTGKVTTLSVTCNVSGAEILLREKVVGRTPLATPIKVTAGHAVLMVRAEEYVVDRREVDLKGGGAMTIDVQLARKDRSSVIVVRSSTQGAHVSVDGTPRGDVPLEMKVAVGTHEITVARDGYRTSTTSFVAREGERREIEVPLAETPSIFSRWWFWTGVAVVVAGGVATYFIVTSERKADEGSISPGVVSGPLRF